MSELLSYPKEVSFGKKLRKVRELGGNQELFGKIGKFQEIFTIIGKLVSVAYLITA